MLVFGVMIIPNSVHWVDRGGLTDDTNKQTGRWTDKQIDNIETDKFLEMYNTIRLVCSTVSRSTSVSEFGGTKGGDRLVPTGDDTIAVIQEGYFTPDEAAWNVACSSPNQNTIRCPSRDCSLDYKLYPINRQKTKSILLASLRQLQALTENENCWSFIFTSMWENNPKQNFLQAFFKGKP
jgi:hypothetical protein